MDLTRRRFLSLLPAPLIVSAANIMPVRAVPPVRVMGIDLVGPGMDGATVAIVDHYADGKMIVRFIGAYTEMKRRGLYFHPDVVNIDRRDFVIPDIPASHSLDTEPSQVVTMAGRPDGDDTSPTAAIDAAPPGFRPAGL